MNTLGKFTVQVEKDLYACSAMTKPLIVSKFENILDPEKQPVKHQIATIDKDR